MDRKNINRQAIGLLVGYALQFLAGMTLNLFVTVSKNHPGSNANNYFVGDVHGLAWTLSGKGGAVLTIHVYIALALVLGSLGLLITSIRLKSKVWIWCSSIAFLSTVGALFNGLSFINYNHSFSSMIMASCWLLAVAALVYGIIGNKRSLQ